MKLELPNRLIVIAQSARILAQMAVNAGFEVIAIDCFADLDTQNLAVLSFKLDSLALDDLKPVFEVLQQDYGSLPVVYGSGFEHFVDSLGYLERHWRLLGNPLSLYKQFQNKRRLFQTFEQLSISYPEVRFTAPDNSSGKWLVKPMQGEGGQEIRFYSESQSITDPVYWQRYCAGQSYSALFIASGDAIEIVGFNHQAIVAEGDAYFTFAGVISQIDLPHSIQRLIAEWLKKLLTVYPLRGLGSLDFMLENRQCYVLEINARVPASAQLYGKQIFKYHLQACWGKLEPIETLPTSNAGYRVLYAKREICISNQIGWPKWVVDRPESGVFIGKGQAICSIIASGENARQVSLQLIRRQRFMENLLKTGH
ncbi:MAG: hypothetical protein RLZ92_1269 [Pseudomonadota bacterium]|jgi:methenyltetrahydromethanopterin cyclohydrolase